MGKKKRKETYRIDKKHNLNHTHEKLLRRGETIINDLKKNNIVPNFVLEIGCGIGSTLVPFKERGIKVIGYDLMESEIEYGKRLGLDLRVGSLDDYKEDMKPDVVIYSHVFEHLTHPEVELQKLYTIMEKEGCLVILLPGLYNMKVHKYNLKNSIVYPHLQYFSLKSLSNFLRQGKFSLIWGNEEIRSIFKKDVHKGEIQSDYKKAKRRFKIYEHFGEYYFPFFRVKRKILKTIGKSIK
jgi:SAM-dependent methyltransferase